MYKPVLSPHVFFPPLCGAAPFPHSASSAPSRAVSSPHVLAVVAVRRTEAQEDSGSLHMLICLFQHKLRKRVKSNPWRSLHTNAGTGLHFSINNGRNCNRSFTQDTNIQTYAFTIAQTHMH